MGWLFVGDRYVGNVIGRNDCRWAAFLEDYEGRLPVEGHTDILGMGGNRAGVKVGMGRDMGTGRFWGRGCGTQRGEG